jgi:tight adherence protein C
MNILLTLGVGILAAAGIAIATGLIGKPKKTTQEKYAEKLSGIEEHNFMSLDEAELSRPLSERVLLPLKEKIAETIDKRMPASQQASIKDLIARAGTPNNITSQSFMIVKGISAIGFALLAAFIFLPFAHIAFPISLLGLAVGIGGWMLPDQWLRQKANARKGQVEDALPDTIDLLTICLDAGLTFDAALQRIADKVEGATKLEFQTLLADIRYGKPRAEAMEAMALRIDSDDLTSFIRGIVQSQKLGVAMGETVRIQASEIRRKRRQKAEEKAAQASLKMLFPMIGCIFPTLFIVLMGPVALLLTHQS